MAAAQIKLEVVTPTRAVLSESVDEVVLPGSLGQLGILPGHLPLLTGLDVGVMTLRVGASERQFFIDRGFAEILDDKISVLTQDCEGVSDIDIENARAEFQEAEKEIGRLEKLSSVEGADNREELLKRYRESLSRARARLVIAGESDRND